MAFKQLTTSPTEADLEAAIHAAVARVFPWLPDGAVRHQTKFSFSFGRATIEVDGASDSRKEARADIILYKDERPLAVLELKRQGIPLSADDDAQGLSYARVLVPSAPLVIVTNGDEVRLLATHTGAPLDGVSTSETGFKALVESAARAAGADLKAAIETLMGSTPSVWRQAVEQTTDAILRELTASWDTPALPFVPRFLLPRKAAVMVAVLLDRGERLILVEGAPIIGKSNVLRELALRSRGGGPFVIFFLEAAGSGVIQALADALAQKLGWPVTGDEARSWLMRLSRSDGLALVLALDGLDPDQADLRREIEDLTSPAFGDRVRVVLAVDDAVAEQLVVGPNGRSPSPIGRRAKRVVVERLDEDEFADAQKALWDQRIAIMDGGISARELRFPWVLRALAGDVVGAPEYANEGLAAALPPLLSLDLIVHARERFTDPELCRLAREVAAAVLEDARDKARGIPLILESLDAYIVRRKTLSARLDGTDIRALITRGYVKPAIHRSGDAVLVVRLSELVASQLADLLAIELAPLSRSAPQDAAGWLAGCAGSLPLGDIICAQAVLDAAQRHGGISFEMIQALIAAAPKEEAIAPGTRFAMHFPGAGMIDLTVQQDGSMVAEIDGTRHLIEANPEGLGSTYKDFHSWQILSHLAGYPFAIELADSLERVDPYILMEVGAAAMVLRQPGPEAEFNGVLTHEIPDVGSIVCHEAGIVEPITLSILKYLSREGCEAAPWVDAACQRNSLPLLARIDIALRQLAGSANADNATWAGEMLSGPVRSAFAGLPVLHPDGSGKAGEPAAV
jgi:hypothetical protein